MCVGPIAIHNNYQTLDPPRLKPSQVSYFKAFLALKKIEIWDTVDTIISLLAGIPSFISFPTSVK